MKRGIPAWLILFSVAVFAVAAFYVLSYSSTDYQGGFPRTAVPLVAPSH
ncbi:MAG: hypothetical protein ACYDCC_15500 [Actinomycetota bacterium]